jgi:hypothetical protein
MVVVLFKPAGDLARNGGQNQEAAAAIRHLPPPVAME